ncbi:hypothetical protein [Microvirga roseola]|nr:hypothetical protein [Microvirga roseola]
MTFGNSIISSSLGGAELFVAALVACGLLMIAISALLPKDSNDKLEWWER